MNEFFMTNFRCNTIWSIIIVIILLPTIVDAWGRSTQQFLLSSRWSTSTMLNMADDGSDRNRNDNNNNNEQSKIRILGVCGGIGSGKSMACKLLVSDLGCMAHIGTLHGSTHFVVVGVVVVVVVTASTAAFTTYYRCSCHFAHAGRIHFFSNYSINNKQQRLMRSLTAFTNQEVEPFMML